MFNRLIKVLISIKLLILVINDRPIVSAPVSSEEVCSVTLVPKELTANKYEESLITVRCEATLDAAVAAETYEFMNPVFDLSFGGAPRTGLFIVRGNSICDGLRHKCWSEYKISANSVGHLIQNSGSVDYVCQVADQIRNDQKNKTQARCQSTGTLTYSKSEYTIGSFGFQRLRNGFTNKENPRLSRISIVLELSIRGSCLHKTPSEHDNSIRMA